MPDEIKQLILVVVVILVISLIVLLIVKLKSNDKNYKNQKNRRLNRKLRKFCRDRDFLFLSNVFLPVRDNTATLVDDIVFGNKYIYLIAQKHWDGNLKGYEYDTKWMVTYKNLTKYVDNPLIGNRFKVQTLLKFLKESDEDNVINIIAINDKTKFNDIKAQPLENISKMSNVFRLIDEYERTSQLNDIKEEEIERIANLIYDESNRIASTQAR